MAMNRFARRIIGGADFRSHKNRPRANHETDSARTWLVSVKLPTSKGKPDGRNTTTLAKAVATMVRVDVANDRVQLGRTTCNNG